MKRCRLTAALLGLGGMLEAQTTGTINGIVRDTSSAIAPHAKILALNEATGYQRSVSADASGGYLIPLAPVGSYTISAELPGFKKAQQTGIVVTVDQNVRAD